MRKFTERAAISDRDLRTTDPKVSRKRFFTWVHDCVLTLNRLQKSGVSMSGWTHQKYEF